MVAPKNAKCYEGKPKYKWNLTAKQPYQQWACSADCKTQTQMYHKYNWYKWICKHCHVKHILAVHDGNNSDSSSQNSGQKMYA